MAETLGIAVCRRFVREAAAAVAGAGLKDVQVAGHGADCDVAPQDWTPFARELAAALPSCEAVLAVGTTCLPPPHLVPDPAALRVHRAECCFQLVAPPALLERLIADGSHLVTPGWLVDWRDRFARWGYDRALARAHFGEFARKLVLLDSGVDEGAAARLDELAEFVGLPAEVVPVGVDFFAKTLAVDVLGWRLERAAAALGEANRRAADNAMVVDLMAALAAPASEADVLAKIAESLRVLLPPHDLLAATVRRGRVGLVHGSLEVSRARADIERVLAGLDGGLRVAADGRGFAVGIAHEREAVGVILVSGLPDADRTHHYAETVLAIAPVWALAIVTARTLCGIVPICASCKRVRGPDGTWNPIESYVSDHSAAVITHGVCPECRRRLYPDLD